MTTSVTEIFTCPAEGEDFYGQDAQYEGIQMSFQGQRRRYGDGQCHRPDVAAGLRSMRGSATIALSPIVNPWNWPVMTTGASLPPKSCFPSATFQGLAVSGYNVFQHRRQQRQQRRTVLDGKICGMDCSRQIKCGFWSESRHRAYQGVSGGSLRPYG